MGLNKEKKHIGDNQAKSSDDLQSAEEKVNHLNGVKSKLESTLDELEDGANKEKRSRAGIEKERRKVEGELKIAQKRKLAAENADLLRVAGEINNNANMVQKVKSSLVAALDEAKKVADDEARERSLLVGKFRNLEHELDGLKSQYDEEVGSREDVALQTNKSEGEAAMWRSKYETEAVAKAEDLEMSKMKLHARLTEAESTVDNLNMKLAQIEKAKAKLHSEIEEMTVSLDQAQILNNSMEKKAKQFDRIVQEWKRKVD